MATLQGFNANNVEPAQDFEPIPAGQYLVTVTESEMKATKDQRGEYLQLTFQILDGPYKGRLLWSRFNLNNPSEKAVKIAQSELAALCRAVGVMTPRDSVDLHNLPLVVKVKLKQRSDSEELANVIKGFAPREAGSGRPQQAQTNMPPWRRG